MHDPIDDRPDPPWPDDVDLGVFARIEIDISLFQGPVFVGLSPEAHRALINLIVSAWRFQPAMSVAAHQPTLAQAAGLGCDLAAWARLEGEVLEHWTECRDRRFYFEPMADAVHAAWSRRSVKRDTDAVRKARQRIRGELAGIGVPDVRNLGLGRIDEVVERMRVLGAHGSRGDRRRELLIRIASDLEMLPDGPVAPLRPGSGGFRQMGVVGGARDTA